MKPICSSLKSFYVVISFFFFLCYETLCMFLLKILQHGYDCCHYFHDLGIHLSTQACDTLNFQSKSQCHSFLNIVIKWLCLRYGQHNILCDSYIFMVFGHHVNSCPKYLTQNLQVLSPWSYVINTNRHHGKYFPLISKMDHWLHE